MMRIVILSSALLVACDENHQLRFQLELDDEGILDGTPSCTCVLSDIVFSQGITIGLHATAIADVAGKTVSDCSTLGAGDPFTAANLPVVMDAVRLENLEPGEVDFQVLITYPPRLQDICAPLVGEPPGDMILHGSSTVTLDGEPPLIPMILECNSACP